MKPTTAHPRSICHLSRRIATLATGLLAGLVGLLSSGEISAQEIHLQAVASIQSSIITLGQVADIRGGNDEDRMALQQLALRPHAMDRPYLTAHEVREALIADGWNLLYWQVIGSNRVQLQGGASGSRTRQLSALRGQAVPSAAEHRFAASPATVSFPTTHPSTQRTAVAQAQWREELVDANVDGGSRFDRSNKRPAVASTVWTFKHDMSRGQVVMEEDLEQVTLARAVPSGAILDLNQIVGQAVRTTVPAGRPVQSNYLEVIKHVQRGKEVKLLSRIGEIEVSTTARCLADGTLGQTVTIESLDRKRQYLGQVIGFNTIQVISNDQVRDGAIVADANPGAGRSAAPSTNRSVPNTLRR